MAKIDVLDQMGKVVDSIELNDEVFGIEPHQQALYDVLVMQAAGKRQGTSKTKGRSEVRGGGRKPYRQKGTGRARQGSIRAPQWVGGGVPFGPRPRDYSIKMNRKERRLALISALSTKAEDMMVVESLTLKTPKTKELKSLLEGLKLENTNTLIIVKELEENMILASRNLQNVVLIDASEVNVLDLISADKILTTEEAIRSIEEVLK